MNNFVALCLTFVFSKRANMQTVFVCFLLNIKNRLNILLVHRIEQNICLVGTSINKGRLVNYYSVTHELRINR